MKNQNSFVPFHDVVAYDASTLNCFAFRHGYDVKGGLSLALGNMVAGFPFSLEGVRFLNSESAYIAGIFSSGSDAHLELQRRLVVRDHKLWQMQMHLDTYFNIIDKDLCTMVGSRLNAKPGDPEFNTCDIWARKPGTLEYKLWKQNLSFVEYVRGRGFQIIPIDIDDELHYANNFLTIAPRHIMAVGGQSETLKQRFRDAGVIVEWIPLESLIDGYGAAHCMTQVLQREAWNPGR